MGQHLLWHASLIASSLVELCKTCFHGLFAATSAVDEAELRLWCCEPVARGQTINFEDQLRDGVDARSMHSFDFIVDASFGNDLTIKDTIGIVHVQACKLGTLKQHLSAVKADGANLSVLAHEPPSRQRNPHQLAFLIAFGGSVLAETVRLHGGGGNPVVGHILVPRTQARLRNEVIEKLPLVLPIIWVLGFGHCEVVSI